LPAMLAEEEAEAAPMALGSTSKWQAFLHKPIVWLSGGLLAGSLATLAVVSTNPAEPQATPSSVTTSAPTELRIEMPAEPAQQVQTTSEEAAKAAPSSLAGSQKNVVRNNAKPAETSIAPSE